MENYKILIVDDEPELLDITSSILRSAGYEVIEASTGNDCLRITREEHPDLILLDVVLSDIDGINVCKRIKAAPELKEIYIILISGQKITSDSQIEGLETGADGYLLRPITGKELLAHVRAMIRIKEMEAALREKMLQMKSILDSAGEGIFVVDENGATLFVNPSLLRMTDFNANELNGKNLHFILHHTKPDGTPYPQQECPIYATLKDGVIRTITDEVFWRKDNTGFPVEYTCAPIIEGDRINGAVITARDITKRKKALEELELKKKEAEEARFLAEVANKVKADFLANMSHELRTPLNSIIGFSEILMAGMLGPVSETQKDYLKDIFESGKHLLGLIHDILDLSEIDTKRVELKLSEINLKELIHSCLNMFETKAIEHFLKVQVEIQDDIGNIVADEKKIKQILFNLLSNAFKFTPDGGSITVRARKVKSSELGVAKGEDLKSPTLEKGDLGGFLNEKDSKLSDFDYIEISVEDTGIGIPEEDQKKLFQPFQQLETVLSKKYAGTGLGLVLCKKFVELHGGIIWVESKGGKGSKFSFVIPIRVE